MPEPRHGASGAELELGFWRGFTAVFRAMRDLSRLTAAWPYALVPGLVFVMLELGLIGLAVRLVQPWIESELGGGGALQNIGAEALSWFAVGLSALLAWMVSAFLAPPISAPALERIVAIVERDLALPKRRSLGFFAELGCGLRSLALSLAVSLPLVLILSVLEFFVAPLAIVTTPLKFLIGALAVAWGLFDYPLTLRGVGARARLALMRRYLGTVLGFGTAFALLFWLPCCGIVLLPVGVAAATSLLAKIDAKEGGLSNRPRPELSP